MAVADGKAVAGRDAGGRREMLEVTLPAVVTVKEGINLPRYPSLPGRLKAKKKPLDRVKPGARDAGLRKIRLMLPKHKEHEVDILGKGAEAAETAVELFRKLGVLPQ